MARAKMCFALALVWMLEARRTVLTYRERGLSEIPEEVFEAANLEKLDLSHNKLTELSERIGDLSHLQELNLGYNKLTGLPESIGNLSMLQELGLSSNKLTALPESIGNLSQLQKLDLGYNKLTALSESIGNLTMLQKLSLSSNKLTALPESIGNLSMLKRLVLSSNKLKELPERVLDLYQLKELNLGHNQLTTLPERIGDLSQLQEINLSYNILTALSERIGDLSQLQKLYLGVNKLAALPERIGDLSQLQKLGLSHNELTALSESIGNLSQLQVLGLSFNELKELPERIGDLSRLQKLYLGHNQLTVFPESIGYLSMLRELGLSYNKLTGLSESIGHLSMLQELDLSSNELASLPESIGGLSMLQWLDLRNNRLTSLPHTIAGLQRLTVLDLRDNPLVERGEGDTLGWRDLREGFGNRVVLSQDMLHGPVTEIKEEDVYARLREEPLHWNIDRLRHIRIDSVPPHTLSAHDLLDIWSDSLSRYAPRVTDGRDMASYIQTLYGVDRNAFRGWHMYTESQAETQDLLEAVLVRLRDSPSDAQVYVPEICEALRWCPDRQIGCLTIVYAALSGTRDTGTFEYFVESRVGVLKSYILDMVVTPAQGTQNVHVRNTWRHTLRDKLGVEGAYESRMGTFGQDMYGGSLGNVLDVFFRKFTPSYVIYKLKDEINESQRRLNEAGAYLHGRLEDEEYARRVFEYASAEDMECMNPQGITAQGVEDILVSMGILTRHTESAEESTGQKTRKILNIGKWKELWRKWVS